MKKINLLLVGVAGSLLFSGCSKSQETLKVELPNYKVTRSLDTFVVKNLKPCPEFSKPIVHSQLVSREYIKSMRVTTADNGTVTTDIERDTVKEGKELILSSCLNNINEVMIKVEEKLYEIKSIKEAKF